MRSSNHLLVCGPDDRNYALKMMNFLLKPMSFVLKTMNAGPATPPAGDMSMHVPKERPWLVRFNDICYNNFYN